MVRGVETAFVSRAGDLIGRRPVVTVDGGDDIDEVNDVAYGPEPCRLFGFTLDERGRFRGERAATAAWDRRVVACDDVEEIGRVTTLEWDPTLGFGSFAIVVDRSS